MGNYNKKVKIDDEWFDTKYRSVVFFGSSSVGKTITINEMLKDKGHTEHGPVGDEQHAMTRCVNPFRLRIDENTSIVLIDPPGFSNLGDAFGYLDFCQNSDPVPPVQEGTEHKNITSLKKLPYKEYPPIIVFVATKDHIIENFRAATKTRLEDNFYKRCAEYIKKNFSFQPHVQAVITYSQEHENETQDWQNQKKLFRQTLQISDNDIFELEHGRENDRNNVEEQRNELQRLIYSFKKEPNHIFKVNNSNSPSGENRSRGQDLRQWINLENVLVAFLSSPWRKVLYERQPYSDNYVGESFLEGLIKNAHVQPYDYWSVVKESTVVSQQISVVAIFIVVFLMLSQNPNYLKFLLGINLILIISGYICRCIFDNTFKNLTKHSFRTGLSALILLGLSPVLRTLTYAYANDTIWALSVSLLGLHLLSHDYYFVNGLTTRFAGSVSLNAAMFVSVLLSSRLPSAFHTFSLIAFAILLFALFPILRHLIKKRSISIHLCLTSGLTVITAILLAMQSVIYTVIYAVVIFSITFLIPLWLIHIQQYKDEIQGPWDEAVPIVSSITQQQILRQ